MLKERQWSTKLLFGPPCYLQNIISAASVSSQYIYKCIHWTEFVLKTASCIDQTISSCHLTPPKILPKLVVFFPTSALLVCKPCKPTNGSRSTYAKNSRPTTIGWRKNIIINYSIIFASAECCCALEQPIHHLGIGRYYSQAVRNITKFIWSVCTNFAKFPIDLLTMMGSFPLSEWSS